METPGATPSVAKDSPRDPEKPIWVRSVVNAHVCSFRDLYLSLGEVAPSQAGSSAPPAEYLAPSPPTTEAQRHFLRICANLPRTIFGETSEQRLSYARVLTLLRRSRDAASFERLADVAVEAMDIAAGEAAAAATKLGDPTTSFQERLGTTWPEDGEALRKWCDTFELLCASGGRSSNE